MSAQQKVLFAKSNNDKLIAELNEAIQHKELYIKKN